MSGKTFERGWRALSLYTGVPIGEMRRAAIDGEFRCRDLNRPKVSHWRLDAWMFARKIAQQNEAPALPMRAAEVAEYTGLPKRLFVTLAQLGTGPHTTTRGGRRVWLREDVDAWRGDVQRRHDDETAAVSHVLDLFRLIRQEFATDGP